MRAWGRLRAFGCGSINGAEVDGMIDGIAGRPGTASRAPSRGGLPRTSALEGKALVWTLTQNLARASSLRCLQRCELVVRNPGMPRGTLVRPVPVAVGGRLETAGSPSYSSVLAPAALATRTAGKRDREAPPAMLPQGRARVRGPHGEGGRNGRARTQAVRGVPPGKGPLGRGPPLRRAARSVRGWTPGQGHGCALVWNTTTSPSSGKAHLAKLRDGVFEDVRPLLVARGVLLGPSLLQPSVVLHRQPHVIRVQGQDGVIGRSGGLAQAKAHRHTGERPGREHLPVPPCELHVRGVGVIAERVHCHHHEANFGTDQFLEEHPHSNRPPCVPRPEAVPHRALRVQARPHGRHGGREVAGRRSGPRRGRFPSPAHQRGQGVVQAGRRGPRQILVGRAAAHHQRGPFPERLHQGLQRRFGEQGVLGHERPDTGGGRPELRPLLERSPLPYRTVARGFQAPQQLPKRDRPLGLRQEQFHAALGEEEASGHAEDDPRSRVPVPAAETLQGEAMTGLGPGQAVHGHGIGLLLHGTDSKVRGDVADVPIHRRLRGTSCVRAALACGFDRTLRRPIGVVRRLAGLPQGHLAVPLDGQRHVGADGEGGQFVPGLRVVRRRHGGALLPSPQRQMGQVRDGMTQQDPPHVRADVFVPRGASQEEDLSVAPPRPVPRAGIRGGVGRSSFLRGRAVRPSGPVRPRVAATPDVRRAVRGHRDAEPSGRPSHHHGVPGFVRVPGSRADPAQCAEGGQSLVPQPGHREAGVRSHLRLVDPGRLGQERGRIRVLQAHGQGFRPGDQDLLQLCLGSKRGWETGRCDRSVHDTARGRRSQRSIAPFHEGLPRVVPAPSRDLSEHGCASLADGSTGNRQVGHEGRVVHPHHQRLDFQADQVAPTGRFEGVRLVVPPAVVGRIRPVQEPLPRRFQEGGHRAQLHERQLFQSRVRHAHGVPRGAGRSLRIRFLVLEDRGPVGDRVQDVPAQFQGQASDVQRVDEPGCVRLAFPLLRCGVRSPIAVRARAVLPPFVHRMLQGLAQGIQPADPFLVQDRTQGVQDVPQAGGPEEILQLAVKGAELVHKRLGIVGVLGRELGQHLGAGHQIFRAAGAMELVLDGVLDLLPHPIAASVRPLAVGDVSDPGQGLRVGESRIERGQSRGHPSCQCTFQARVVGRVRFPAGGRHPGARPGPGPGFHPFHHHEELLADACVVVGAVVSVRILARHPSPCHPGQVQIGAGHGFQVLLLPTAEGFDPIRVRLGRRTERAVVLVRLSLDHPRGVGWIRGLPVQGFQLLPPAPGPSVHLAQLASDRMGAFPGLGGGGIAQDLGTVGSYRGRVRCGCIACLVVAQFHRPSHPSVHGLACAIVLEGSCLSRFDAFHPVALVSVACGRHPSPSDGFRSFPLVPSDQGGRPRPSAWSTHANGGRVRASFHDMARVWIEDEEANGMEPTDFLILFWGKN
eukprot:scaffold47_cov334-Pavlova_lutheri.AAC.2